MCHWDGDISWTITGQPSIHTLSHFLPWTQVTSACISGFFSFLAYSTSPTWAVSPPCQPMQKLAWALELDTEVEFTTERIFRKHLQKEHGRSRPGPETPTPASGLVIPLQRRDRSGDNSMSPADHPSSASQCLKVIRHF